MIKYQNPKPIKAQKGEVLIINSPGAKENARRRAIAQDYFDAAPSIPNLLRGAYYWARSIPMLFGEQENPYLVTGTVPAVATPGVGAIRYIPLGLGAASILFGGNYSTTMPRARGVTIDMTNSSDTTSTRQPTPSDTTSTGRNQSTPSDNNQSPEIGPLDESLEEWRKLGRNIVRGITSPKFVLPAAGVGGITGIVKTYISSDNQPQKSQENPSNTKIDSLKQQIESLREQVNNQNQQRQQQSQSPDTIPSEWLDNFLKQHSKQK